MKLAEDLCVPMGVQGDAEITAHGSASRRSPALTESFSLLCGS